jgi:general secretion pathway protein D
MQKKQLFFLLIILPLLSCAESVQTPTESGTGSRESIAFQYDNEELINVVNFIASKKGVNILFPTKTDEKLTGKLTWHLDKKVAIDQAWQLLQTILNIAGYALLARPTYYELVKIAPGITREPVPLYIGVPLENLPTGNERIRYIYYLANIKQESETEGELPTVLKSLLPSDALFKIDTATNALIIMAQAADIRSAMSIITQLDRPGFQERMEIIKLHYTNARMVADLFNTKILQGADSQRYRLDTKKQSESTYFSRHLKIIANDKTNSLIVLGRPQAIERIREFINHYIDVEPDSGKSILHVYQLQYLDAPSFAKVLENIVQAKATGGVEQATGERKPGTGPQRYFDEVIIAVDTPPESAAESFATPTAGTTTATPEGEIQPQKYFGGNKLIIAARNDDWKRIRELIEKLDKPSPQVLIEVLIADLTLDDTRALGTIFRNPAKIPMPGEVNFQSAQLPPGVMPDSFATPQTIGAIAGGTATDLLRQFNNSNPRQDTPANTNIAALLQTGSTVLSFSDNDGKTWGISQILKILQHNKILSNPHVISTNNQVATIKVSEIRLLPDQASGSQGGTIVQTNKDIPAELQVYIVPRISISDIRESTVSLNVTVDINEYRSTTDNTRITRKVKTNAIVNTGDILALGGLLRSNEADSIGETPVLSRIPVIGWLFKRRQRAKERTNLTVFISPTIIEPRSRDGLGEYTKDYLNITKTYAGAGGLFDSLKDPITRWFFHEESPTERFSKDFVKNDEIQLQKNKIPMPTISNNEQPIQMTSTSNLLALQEDQLNQLKDLLKDIDNPFQKVADPLYVQNNTARKPASIDEQPEVKKGRKRRR